MLDSVDFGPFESAWEALNEDLNTPGALGGIFTGLRAFRREFLATLPERDAFEDLRDWMWPALANQTARVSGRIYSARDCVWEPVGTPAEYLRVWPVCRVSRLLPRSFGCCQWEVSWCMCGRNVFCRARRKMSAVRIIRRRAGL